MRTERPVQRDEDQYMSVRPVVCLSVCLSVCQSVYKWYVCVCAVVRLCAYVCVTTVLCLCVCCVCFPHWPPGDALQAEDIPSYVISQPLPPQINTHTHAPGMTH